MTDPSDLPHKLVFSSINLANRMRGKAAIQLTEDDHQHLAAMILDMYKRKYDPAISKPSTFLTKSARLALKSLATSRQRAGKRPQMIQAVLFNLDKESRPITDHPDSCIEDLDRVRSLQEVRDNLECLEPRKAEVIRRRDFEGQSYAEIAEAMGISKARAADLRADGLIQLKFLLNQFAWDSIGGDKSNE